MTKGVQVFDGDGDYTENVKKLMEENGKLQNKIHVLEGENRELHKALIEERRKVRQRGDTLWRITQAANETLAEEIPEEPQFHDLPVPKPYSNDVPIPYNRTKEGKTAEEAFRDLMSSP